MQFFFVHLSSQAMIFVLHSNSMPAMQCRFSCFEYPFLGAIDPKIDSSHANRINLNAFNILNVRKWYRQLALHSYAIYLSFYQLRLYVRQANYNRIDKLSTMNAKMSVAKHNNSLYCKTMRCNGKH